MARAIPPGYHAEYLAAIVDSSEDVIVSKTLDGTIISWNPAAKKIFGYTAEEAIGKHITLIIPSERWSEEEEVLARLRRGERIEHFETIRRTKDGRILNISLTVSPIRDEMGKIVGASKIARDITERKRAEAMIAADLAAMKRLHQIGSLCARGQTSVPECLEQILDAAIEFTAGDKGNVQLFDTKSNALTIAAQRGFEAPFLRFFATLGDNPAACGTALRANDRIIVEDVMHSDIFAGSEAREVLLSAGVRAVQSSPLLSSTGNVLGMISTHYAHPFRPDDRQLRLLDLLARTAADFLQRIKAEEELRERADELAALNFILRDTDRRKDEFLAMLGHELRNPLAAVQNSVAVASLDEANRRRALEIARRQTEQLGRLIDDLLDVARITHGRIYLRKQWVSLAEIIRRAIESTQSFIANRGIRLENTVPIEPIPVDADPARLEQVFVNLLTNAGKYTDVGGRISLNVEIRPDSVAVRIRDTGIGISKDLLMRIWDLFAQANQSLDRSQGGLGVGLTITRRLVELHGGRVEAHSDGPGRGSEFVVILPLLQTQVSETVQQSTDRSSRSSVRVLLVEDNTDASESMTMLLESLGHRVRSAADGLAAIEAARADPPDVMLVDIGLPSINGYEVARRVRNELGLKDVVLVALTGYGREEDKRNAMAAGFDYHLVKPVDPEALGGFVSGLGSDASAAKRMGH